MNIFEYFEYIETAVEKRIKELTIVHEPLVAYKKAEVKINNIVINEDICEKSIPVIITLEIPKYSKICRVRSDINDERIKTIIDEAITDAYLKDIFIHEEEMMLIPMFKHRLQLEMKKCRSSCAKVLCIEDLYEPSFKYDSAYSSYNNNFIYKLGNVVGVDNFRNDLTTCGEGIHFFLNRSDVEAFNF